MLPKPDADALLFKTLTWLLLVSYMASVYVLVMALGTLPFGDPLVNFSPPWWLNLIAFVAIALTVMPVYRWVRAGMREVVYSQPASPFPLAQFDRGSDATLARAAILPTMASTIAQMLKLPYVEIIAEVQDAAGDGRHAVAGTAPADAVLTTVPLVYHGQAVGELRVAGRLPAEPLSRSDLAALHDLAHYVGITLYAAQVSADLQRARERLVLTREEERRRIRNDLHDGLAPTLSALQLQLGVARKLLRQDPERAAAAIDEMREDLRGATAEIRQLVYDLRPPLLDELGLVGALKSLAPPDSEFCFEVNCPGPLPALSAALEVAVFRIASEAIHNVTKHARATECVVRLEASDGSLRLTVTDNGVGLPEDVRAGVGTFSARERAAELGGMLVVQAAPNGGACVLGEFPLPG
ncbi:MAG TPA: GAF domain-containing sensor histidine kinase [Anaerolineae bacterium]